VCRSAVFVGVLLFAGRVALGASDELKQLLDRPLTPGALALLAGHTNESAAIARIQAALTDSSGPVRAVGARLVGLGAIKDLVADVRGQLANETDPDAAREEIRTLFSLAGPAYDAAVLQAVVRFGHRLDGDVVRTAGRARGMEAAGFYFSNSQNLSLSSEDRKAFFRLARRESKGFLVAASSQALGNRDSAAWKAVLAIAQEKKVDLDPKVLIQALRSDDPVVRGETAWYLAGTSRPNPEDRNAILDVLTRSESLADPELGFGSEMLRRTLGQAPVEDTAWIACLETNPDCHLDTDFFESPLVAYLTPREKEALARRTEAHMPGELRAQRASMKSSSPGTSPPPPAIELRLVNGLPRGVAKSLFKAGGCSGPSVASAEMHFRTDGLPRRVSLDQVPVGRGCDKVAEALFLMSMVPDTLLPIGSRVVYVAFFDPECLVCNEVTELPREGPTAAAQEVFRVRGAVKPPTVLSKAEPSYPEAARRQHQEGISIYEAIITQTGCVTSLRVVQSSYPMLDVSGMNAIARWRYRPAELNGSPVTVYLTVTMNYSLHH
jgi:TonB family protein